MKRQLLAAVTALTLLLTSGCSALLSRQYVHVTNHTATPTAEGDPSVLRAESIRSVWSLESSGSATQVGLSA